MANHDIYVLPSNREIAQCQTWVKDLTPWASVGSILTLKFTISITMDNLLELSTSISSSVK